MTSRVLGVVREQVLASMFGAGDAMDAYNVAFRIPNLVRDLFAEGAMSAAFVPTFTRRLVNEGQASAWRLGSVVITTLLLITGVITAAGMLGAEPLARALAGDFTAVPGKMTLTVMLTRIMMPFLMMVSVATALMGMLTSLRRFFVPALAPAMFNVGTIVTIVILTPLMTSWNLPPITAVAIGTLVGGLGQVALQWPLAAAAGFRYTPLVDWRDPGLRRVLWLMGPGTVGLAATQINVFVNTVLATGQGTGAVSWLNYAFRIMYLPIGLFGVSVATATMPALAGHAAAGDRRALKQTLAQSLRLMLVLSVPATCGLVALAVPIVRVIFERRAFTPDDTLATAVALQLYAIGLVGYSVVRIATPTFYALDDSRTPVQITATAVVVNVALNIALVEAIGYRGLALGTSLAALVHAGIVLWVLGRRLGGLDAARLLSTLGRLVVATSVMTAVALGTFTMMSRWWVDPSTIAQILRLLLSIGAALIGLYVSARMLRLEELTEALGLIRSRGRP